MHAATYGDGDPADTGVLTGLAGREPDTSGAFADVYIDGADAVKVVAHSDVHLLRDNIGACMAADIPVPPTAGIERDLPGYGPGTLVVRQPRLDILDAEPADHLDRVAPLARRAAGAGFAIDVKPSSYGEHRGGPVYHDVQDLGSVRRVPEPERAMAAQAAHHLDGGRYGTDDIMARWFE